MANDVSNEMTQPTYTNKGNEILSKDTETSGEGNDWIFNVTVRSLRENFDILEVQLESFGIIKPSVGCLAEAWILNVNELQNFT